MIDTTRPLPSRCFRCKSKTMVMHCTHLGPPHCNWTVCQACGAVCGYVYNKETPHWRPVVSYVVGGKRGS